VISRIFWRINTLFSSCMVLFLSAHAKRCWAGAAKDTPPNMVMRKMNLKRGVRWLFAYWERPLRKYASAFNSDPCSAIWVNAKVAFDYFRVAPHRPHPLWKVKIILLGQLAFHFAAQLGKINKFLSQFFIRHYSSPLGSWLSFVTARGHISGSCGSSLLHMNGFARIAWTDYGRFWIVRTFQAWEGDRLAFQSTIEPKL
jgi:hypothetical protein